MAANVIASIANLLWPIIVLIAFFKLWPFILKMTRDATEVKVKISGYQFSSSRETSEILIKPILNELKEAIDSLTVEQRETFVVIYRTIYMDGEDYEIPNSFERRSTYHYTLRALKNVNFIRRVGGEQWKPGAIVQIKNFGRLAVKLKGKELGL